YAPDWNLIARGGHRMSITNGLALATFLNYHYRSAFSGHADVPAEAAVGELPGYGVANLRVDLEDGEAGWTLGLWVRNLLNETYVTRVKHDGLFSYMEMFGEPRSWGVESRYVW